MLVKLIPCHNFVYKKNFRMNQKTLLFKARLHIPFTYAFTALHCVFWFVDVYGKRVITLKMQCNAENACGNQMRQLGFKSTPLFFLHSILSSLFLGVKTNSCLWFRSEEPL